MTNEEWAREIVDEMDPLRLRENVAAALRQAQEETKERCAEAVNQQGITLVSKQRALDAIRNLEIE